MADEVIMPMLGMAQNTGKLLTWLKQPGDSVAVGDVLFEVETDKSVSEVEAQASGYLSDVQAAEGSEIPVGQVIAMITDSPQEDAVPDAVPAEPAPEQPKMAEPTPSLPTEPEAPKPALPAAGSGRILASPKARKLAAAAGLDLSRLADAGVEQPYHVADLETLKTIPVGNQMSGAASHISAVVPAAGFDGFIEKMQNEAGIALTLEQVTMAFAAAGLRKAIQAEMVTVSVLDGEAGRLVFSDPDRLRLSALAGAGTISDLATSIELRNAGSGFLTNIAWGQVNQPTLVIARNDSAFYLTLSFSADSLTADHAIETMHELTVRLAEPMLALV